MRQIKHFIHHMRIYGYLLSTSFRQKLVYRAGVWMDILHVVIGLIAGLVIGFFLARYFMKKYLKKNPPINEEMIKAMMMQMGRKPSQKQVNQIMKSMEKYQ